MPQINRIRVNNIKYNFGTQFYDDFLMRFSCKNTIYDLANGGGKSVLMLLLLQTMLPNCTLDEKQPIEKLFAMPGGSTTIHSLVEWKLDSCDVKNGYRYMTCGFCARKAKGSEDEDSRTGIEYFNYCIFYREFGDNDIKNLPLSDGKERITYNGLKAYLRGLEKKDMGVRVELFEKKGEYLSFINDYGIYESHWELIRGINKTEGHVRTYFESNYRTTRKVVEDLLIEEIIEKSYNNRIRGGNGDDEMSKTLLEIKDKLLELAKRNGLDKVFVHCFLDGRDTPPASGKDFVAALEEKMKELGVGKVASVMGRYYAMDRDNRWDRVELAYKALTAGEGNKGTSATELIQASYDDGKTDEFVVPAVVTGEDGNAIGTIKDNDSVIFFNFRPDRAREMTRAFCDDEFTGFARAKRIKTTYVCFVDYDETIPNKLVAFKKETIRNTLGEFLAAHGKTQARIAETEKYAHVTFFFNGGVEEPNPGEDRILVKSPKVATYDLQPEMSAPAVCEKLTDAIRSGKYDVIIVNFANPDMVGHTGVENAAVKAIEAVDECVGKAVEAIKEVDGVMFICADHGNAEQLIDYKTGEPWTAHTTNPVPFILVNAGEGYGLREGGCLADIAPTLIELMGMEQPKEMTGKSLLVRE